MLELGLIVGGWLGGVLLFVAVVYWLMRLALWREKRRRLRAQAVHPLGARRLP